MASIVVDTSTLLHSLAYVQELAKKGPENSTEILLARELLRELDRIKDRFGVSGPGAEARAAINWISSVFNFQDPETPALRGQAIHESRSPGLTGDDAILDCALYNVQTRVTVLLSEDKNLCNRAMIDGIMSFQARQHSTDEILAYVRGKCLGQMELDDPAAPGDSPVAPGEPQVDRYASDSGQLEGCPQNSVGNQLGTKPEQSEELPAPVAGPNMEAEILTNIGNLLDWHVHQHFDDGELAFLQYRRPQTPRDFARVLQQFGFSFDVHLPAKVVAKFCETVKSGVVDQAFVNGHVDLFLRLARNDHRYRRLLDKYDQDAMTD